MLKKKLKPHIGVKSIILIAVCAALIALDLLTKFFAKFYDWDVVIIRGWIELDGSIPNNPGCAFSFLNEHPEIGQPIFISLTFVLLVALVGAFVLLPERFTLMKVTIAIVVAGAIGNLVDRLAFRSVRDFIGLNMQFDTERLVYCNIADFCVVIGAILAVLDLMFLDEWAVFPLTKRAKAAQAKRKEEESKKNESRLETPQPSVTENTPTEETEGNSGEKE